MYKISKPPGYYWAPAGMEQLHKNHLSKVPSSAYEPTIKVRKKAGTKATFKVLEGFNSRIIFSYLLKPKDCWSPGDDVLRATGFGLYNAQDKSYKASHLAQAAALGKLCYRIQDSGGFQLFTGVKSFVDPVELAKLHDTFADSGVGLDLPLSIVDDKDLVAGGARMMAANSVILQRERKEKWALMNVSHGFTPQLRGIWQKIALRDPLDSLCVAGLRGSIDDNAVGANPVAIASHMLVSFLYPAKYQHYHLLGLSSVIGILLASLIANLHQKVVTSDSTTYLGGQQFKRFINGTLSANAPLSHRRLPCSCRICAYVEHEYWYDALPAFMSIHNAFVIHDTCLMANGLARTALEKKLTAGAMVKMFYDSNIGLERRMIPAMIQACKLILNTTTYEAALQLKYTESALVMSTLFPTKAADKKDWSRFRSVIQGYEKYHGKKFLI